jgi:hypothetical protein
MTTETIPEIAFEPIECEYFDKENLGWAKSYVEKCQKQLEEGADDLAPQMRSYLETEIAAYQELMERFAKK